MSYIDDNVSDDELLQQLLAVSEPKFLAVSTEDEKYEPFPLTEIQKGYLLGRNASLPLGGVPCQFYYELDCSELDPVAYHAAWLQLIDRHEMLRCIILNHEEQKILPSVPDLTYTVHDLTICNDPESKLDDIRQRIATEIRPHEQWPLFGLEFSRLPDSSWRIHFGLDLLIMDQQSFLTLLDEAAVLYHSPNETLPAIDFSFRDYVLLDSKESVDPLAVAYWKSKVAQIPSAPALPLNNAPDEMNVPSFHRLVRTVNAKVWQEFKRTCIDKGLTPSTLLLTLFGEVLSQWSDNAHFSLNMTMFNRKPLHSDVDRLVGDFTNTMIFEMDMRPLETKLERARRLQQQLWDDIEHQDYSGMNVMSDMATAANQLGGILMPVVFTSTLTQNDARLLKNQHLQPGYPVHARGQTAQVLLDNQITEMSGELLVQWDVVEGAFPAQLIETMLETFIANIHGISAGHSSLDVVCYQAAKPSSTDLVMQAHEDQPNALLQSLWLQNWGAHADKPAIIQDEQVITHGHLARIVAALVEQLNDLQLKSGEPVPVMLSKGPAQIAACLAILIAGGAYVPVSLQQPQKRKDKILTDLNARVVLSESTELELPSGISVICTDITMSGDLACLEESPCQAANELAYIIYTSGSTGMPKGVMITHQAAMNTVLDINARFNITEKDCVLSLSALHFDLSVYDIFGVLGQGGALVLPSEELALDPSHWASLCRQYEVTLWNSVPSLFALFVDYVSLHPNQAAEIPLQTVMMSGDWIPLDLPESAWKLWPELTQYSLGGATEASIWSIYYPIKQVESDWVSIPYGNALGGQQVYVLDQQLNIAPNCKEGEIYIAGKGLACGYFSDEDKTQQSFFSHPETGVELYKTGDHGRYRDDGSIEFLGRKDNQVKVNGYRVETGEIMTVINKHPKVKDALVMAVGERHQMQLVAFVVGSERLEGELIELCQSALPSYMVPVAWYFLEQWPLTVNAKLDRSVLKNMHSTPEQPAIPSQDISFSTNMTPQVLSLLGEVLKQPAIQIQDSLLDLGATSVDLIAIATHIEARFGFRPRLPDLARSPTVKSIVDLISQHCKHSEKTTNSDTMQWFADQTTASDYFASHQALNDQKSRLLFKQSRVAIRNDLVEQISLPQLELPDLKWFRESRRSFAQVLPTETQLGQWFEPLRSYFSNGQRKFNYGSAGGQQAVQTYLLINPKFNTEQLSGAFYYQPDLHQLQRIASELSDELFSRFSIGNGTWVNDASFMVVFVLELAAIAPLYEQASVPFGLIETGAISQLLEMSAQQCGLSVCQIGDARPELLKEALSLDSSQLFLSCMVGGATNSTSLPQLSFTQSFEEGSL
ncbi:amino acid adenylation domain-containing protein [Photobacterium atrarenae]|uniref:Amino acid adenylation domain-containing protein n=1 Tax=Photobacterium atrarenae TaxID=865757 RepID=A0ABY5GM65_9GAMM|nr:amino acid adenylation domain-containing protein [Photobacterium atrarenae]UTV29799.1 amino acid adenylation domain-containing protein [Photobacterium atrarenae]